VSMRALPPLLYSAAFFSFRCWIEQLPDFADCDEKEYRETTWISPYHVPPEVFPRSELHRVLACTVTRAVGLSVGAEPPADASLLVKEELYCEQL
jgi:hypothetical protein